MLEQWGQQVLKVFLEMLVHSVLKVKKVNQEIRVE